jgi:hypothetical protein
MQIQTFDEISKWFISTNQATALIGMALGIIFKYFYDYSLKYFQAPDKSKVIFDWKGFKLIVLLSGFLSIIMYSGLLSTVAKLESDLLVLSVAAQNGFFWQTIIGKLSEKTAALPGAHRKRNSG